MIVNHPHKVRREASCVDCNLRPDTYSSNYNRLGPPPSLMQGQLTIVHLDFLGPWQWKGQQSVQDLVVLQVGQRSDGCCMTDWVKQALQGRNTWPSCQSAIQHPANTVSPKRYFLVNSVSPWMLYPLTTQDCTINRNPCDTKAVATCILCVYDFVNEAECKLSQVACFLLTWRSHIRTYVYILQ